MAAVLDATRAELLRVGYGALSVERVAEIAGVAKTTVYRRWPRKPELVRDALLAHRAPVDVPEDRGTLLEQLTAFAYTRVQGMLQPEGQCTVRMLYGESQNPEVQELIRSLRQAKLSVPLELFQRAVRRGEIGEGVDAELALQMIMGSLHHRIHLLGERPNRSTVRELTRAVLYGVTSGSSEATARSREEGLSPDRERS